MSFPFEVARDRMQIYNAVRNVDKTKHRNTAKPNQTKYSFTERRFCERYSLQIKSRERLLATMRVCYNRYTHGLDKSILSCRKSKGSF